jgi:hypothetical protein
MGRASNEFLEMPKKRNKKNGTIQATTPSFATGFNPNSTYGRTKKEPFLSTSAGHNAIGQDKQGYLGYIARQGGVNVSSANPSAFGQWLQNNKFADIENDYNAATNINPELSFAHYAQTLGIPGDPTKLKTDGMATNNAYTANSTIGSVPAATGGGKGKKKNKPPKFNQYAQGVVQGGSMATPVAQWRREFARLTPQQQGTYSQGYAFGPAGWSVF